MTLASYKGCLYLHDIDKWKGGYFREVPGYGTFPFKADELSRNIRGAYGPFQSISPSVRSLWVVSGPNAGGVVGYVVKIPE